MTRNIKIISISFAIAILIGYAYISYFLPIPAEFLNNQGETSKIFDRNGKLLYEILIPKQGKTTKIALDRIPKTYISAVLSTEDINFYSHGVIDWKALLRAVYSNIKSARIVSGGSTITLQLAKNLLGTNLERTAKNKIKELLYGIRLERAFSKDEILELYANKIYFGNLSYGIESAALDYFGKSATNLDLSEIALLAGLPQSPHNYNPFINYKKARERQAYVLDLMLKNKFITTIEANAAKDQPLKFRQNKYQIKAPHFVQFIISELEEKYGWQKVHFDNLKIYTTLNLDIQAKAEQILENKLKLLKDNNVQSGSVIVLDTSSREILAWIGSKDYFDEEIDGAVDVNLSLRQPGSALKPFTYWLALMKGYTPATTINDIYTQFQTEDGAYAPKNYDLQFHGIVRLRSALASSLNIPAVKTLEFVGVSNLMSFLKTLGINSLTANPSHYGLALTLGGAEVKPIELAGAYSVLANYGVKQEITYVTKILDKDNEDIFEEHQVREEQIQTNNNKQTAYQIVDILSDKNARLIGFGETPFLDINRQAAVKTGTTRNFKDNWTIGFTPDFLTLVWVGNADASPMDNISGITGAAPIWQDIMLMLHKDKEKKDFEIPKGLVKKEICKLSGLLPTEYCKERILEYFIEGTEPTKTDTMHQMLTIDPVRNRVIGDDCNDKGISTIKKLFIVYPPELRRFAMTQDIEQPPEELCGIGSMTFIEEEKIISIAYPQDGDSFLIDSKIPAKSSKIPFRVNVRQDVTKVIWYVNGKKMKEMENFPYTYLFSEEDILENKTLTGRRQYIIYAEGMLNTGQIIRTSSISFALDDGR